MISARRDKTATIDWRAALAGLILAFATASPAAAQQALLDHYNTVVSPALVAAASSEAAIPAAIETWASWKAFVQSDGFEEELVDQLDDAEEKLGKALDNAIRQSSADCVANRDPSEANDIAGWFGASQSHGIDLKVGGELEARIRNCARFDLKFHSVIFTRQGKNKITSTVSGSVLLEIDEGELNIWRGGAESLDHISLVTNTKNRARGCKQTWGGDQSTLAVDSARITLASAYADGDGASQTAKPTALVVLQVGEVDEYLKVVCKSRGSRPPITIETPMYNFNLFLNCIRIAGCRDWACISAPMTTGRRWAIPI